MKRYDWDFLQIKKAVTEKNRPLICYGAGMAARHIGCLLKKYELLNQVIFWVDGDRNKTSSSIEIEGRKFDIREKEVLQDWRYKDALLLITCEDDRGIVEGLQKEGKAVLCDYCSCLPALNKLVSQVIQEEPKIPKKIHYCWFGNNSKPKLMKQCIISCARIMKYAFGMKRIMNWQNAGILLRHMKGDIMHSCRIMSGWMWFTNMEGSTLIQMSG